MSAGARMLWRPGTAQLDVYISGPTCTTRRGTYGPRLHAAIRFLARRFNPDAGQGREPDADVRTFSRIWVPGPRRIASVSLSTALGCREPFHKARNRYPPRWLARAETSRCHAAAYVTDLQGRPSSLSHGKPMSNHSASRMRSIAIGTALLNGSFGLCRPVGRCRAAGPMSPTF